MGVRGEEVGENGEGSGECLPTLTPFGWATAVLDFVCNTRFHATLVAAV